MFRCSKRLASSVVNSLVKASYVGNVGVIQLNDPSKLNALSVELGKQFVVAVREMVHASNMQQIRSCIIKGSGRRMQFTYVIIILSILMQEMDLVLVAIYSGYENANKKHLCFEMRKLL